MSDGQYVSFMGKIIDIGPVNICKIIYHERPFHIIQDDSIVFNNGEKRIQKLKRTTIVADKTNSLNMNIWQNQFDSIKENFSYIIKLAKVKIFNNDVSLTTTIHTS